MPAQLTVPDGHAQLPFWQIRFAPHVAKQSPQLVLLFWRSTHWPPHCVKPEAAQRMAHVPSLQTGALPPHRFPHIPQFVLLDARSTQLPGPARRPAHCVYPGGH
jgi:hypothetical protein